MKSLSLICLFLASISAHAESFSWTNGTGNPTPDGTKLYCTTTKPYGQPNATIPIAQTSATFTLAADVVPLTYFCVARHYKGAVESANSNEIQVQVAAVPLPTPTQFRITIDMMMNQDGTVSARISVYPLDQVVAAKP